MAGTGSHEPHVFKTGRKVPQRTGEIARFDALKAEAERRGQPQPSRVRPFPLRTAVSSSHQKVSPPAPPKAIVQPDAAPAEPRVSFVETTPADTKPLPRTSASVTQSALQLATRAARLTADATLILLFSPVIAVWWLLERRHRKGGR